MPRRSLGRASLVLLGSTWVLGGLALVASVMIGRVLGAAAVGALSLNLGIAGLIMAAALPGFARAHLKRLAEGSDAGRCVGTMAVIQGALTVVLAVALLLAWRLGALDEAPAGATVLALMLAAQVASRLADVFMQVFIAREQVVIHSAIVLASRTARVVATAVVLLVAPSLDAVATTFLLESLLTGVAAVTVLAAQGVGPRTPSLASIAGYWRFAHPFLITTPIALAQDSIDRVLVARWAGLTAAGYYHVARGMWEALSGVMAPPGLLLFTRLSSLYAERSPERDRQARTLFFNGLDKLLFLSTALAIVFWTLAEPVLRILYGPAFVGAVPTLRVLVLASLAAVVVNPYTFVLQAQDEVARFVPVNLVRFVLYLVALYVLIQGVIPWLPEGAEGAAVARLLLILFPAWVWFGWTQELAGIPFYRPALLYVAAFALAVAGGELIAALVTPAGRLAVFGPAIAALVGLGAYMGVLLAMHPRTTINLREIRALVSWADTPR